MKKMISILLAMMMLLMSLPVFGAKEDATKMQEVLLLVKEKITVPKELSEFSGDVSDYNGIMSYYFSWTSPDYEKSMSVSSDEQGRIKSYNKHTFKGSDKRLSHLSKTELIAFAEAFLKTTVPEAFASETDLLVYDEEGYYVSGNLMYNIGFNREKDGIPVKDNYANVCLSVVDEEIQVRSMDIHFAYDAEFDEKREDITEYQEKYQALFPVELVYQDEYKPLAKGNEPRFTPVLIYRIKDNDVGYMSSSTGEILTEDTFEDDYKRAPEAEDSTVNMDAAVGGSSLTPQEMAELEQVEGLLSYQDIEKVMKKLPYLDFSDKLELESRNLYKDSYGNYYFRMRYSWVDENADRYFSAIADAKTGEVIEISNDFGYHEERSELTESQKRGAEKKMTEFLNAIAKEKFAETEKRDAQEYGNMLTDRYVRMVHGVPYLDNGIRISFDAKNNVVRNYSLDFTEAEFTDPQNAIGEAKAYEKILEYAPIQPVYIKCDGLYQKAFSLSEHFLSVDAITGENRKQEISTDYDYDDIKGHWVEAAATKLSEIQVGLPGGALNPEVAITQEDFLRFLASAVMGQGYNGYTTEELYERLMRNGLITEEEKFPESQVKREDAFVYIIRMAGLEKVAKLTEIYRVTYSDQGELSNGKLGYAAILSGFGVVCGDGGNLRPQDALTRAEAIALVYKYLLSL